MRRGSVGPEGVLVPVLDMDQELCDVENLRQRKVAQIRSNRVLDGFGFLPLRAHCDPVVFHLARFGIA